MSDAFVSMRAYARMRGVALSTIQGAIAAGHIRPTADGLIDVAASDESWFAAHLARQQGSGHRSTARVARAKVAAGAAKVQLARHRLTELEAAYIDRGEAEAALREDLEAIAAAVRALPETQDDAVAAELGRDRATAERVLREFVVELLEELGDLPGDVDAIIRRAA